MTPTAIGTACATLLLLVAGCGGEAEPQTRAPRAAAPPTPTAPPKPAVTPVADLMARLSIDERVNLPEGKAPPTTEDRVAVLEFFDAFARGDADALRTMLPLTDELELDALIESGAWEKTIDGIDGIAIETGPGPYDEKCALAIFEVDGDFQPQLWYYHAEGEAYQFDAAPTPPDMINKLYGDDWIALWHEILEEEMALADKPDEEFDVPTVDLDSSEDRGGTFGSGTSPGTTPNSPGGPPGRRPPPPRRRPPGPG
ncbi:MAG: hypothetical protein SYC29_09655 [Planctomycetota bacterium]|nr:hypothetical protein [Planctomycetota bacterium]